MKRSDFYRAVAQATGMTIKDTKVVFETAQEILFDAVNNGEEVKLFDGVTFTKVLRAARSGRNPSNGEPFEVPAKNVPKVKIGKAFKDAIV